MQSNHLKHFANKETDTYLDLVLMERPSLGDRNMIENMNEYKDAVGQIEDVLKCRNLVKNKTSSSANDALRQIHYHLLKNNRNEELLNEFKVEPHDNVLTIESVDEMFKQQMKHIYTSSIQKSNQMFNERGKLI